MMIWNTVFDRKTYAKLFWHIGTRSWRVWPLLAAEGIAVTMLVYNIARNRPYKIMSAVVVLLVLAAWLASIWYRLRQTAQEFGITKAGVRLQYTLSEQKVTVQNLSTGKRTAYAWSNFSKFQKAGSSLYLYLENGQIMALQQVTKAQAAAIGSYAQAGLTERKKIRDGQRAMSKQSKKKGES